MPATTWHVTRTIICLAAFFCFGCGSRHPANSLPEAWEPPERLSEHGLFQGNGAAQEPAADVLPYDINTPFFSDHATKYRFIRLPPGMSVEYRDSDVLEFPTGTIIVKTFAYLNTVPSGARRLIETRLLIHRPEGWIGLPYIWNEEQSEAYLKVAGGTQEVRWLHTDGLERKIRYIIPNVNQCMGCHENNKVMRPIGPKARNLNRNFVYAGGGANQLAHWKKIGFLRGAPDPEQTPRLAVWNDPAASVTERARAWLDMNCAHCHNSNGPARTSGLDLSVGQTDSYRLGLWKTPVAAGRGSGGRSYDIVPGKPDESILVYRIQSTEPGVMMPELHRLVDEGGAALIRQWIASMPYSSPRK